jgi:hypothetical protein
MGAKWIRVRVRQLPTLRRSDGRVAKSIQQPLKCPIIRQNRILRHKHNDVNPIPDPLKGVLASSTMIEGFTRDHNQFKPSSIEMAKLSILRTGVNNQP